MSDLELVMDALIAGAAAGVASVAGSAVQDAYTGFREAVRHHLSARGTDVAVLDADPTEPDVWRMQLRGVLSASEVAQNEDLVAAAKALLLRLGADGARSGSVTVDAREAKGVVAGDGNVQINTFH